MRAAGQRDDVDIVRIIANAAAGPQRRVQRRDVDVGGSFAGQVVGDRADFVAQTGIDTIEVGRDDDRTVAAVAVAVGVDLTQFHIARTADRDVAVFGLDRRAALHHHVAIAGERGRISWSKPILRRTVVVVGRRADEDVACAGRSNRDRSIHIDAVGRIQIDRSCATACRDVGVDVEVIGRISRCSCFGG